MKVHIPDLVCLALGRWSEVFSAIHTWPLFHPLARLPSHLPSCQTNFPLSTHPPDKLPTHLPVTGSAPSRAFSWPLAKAPPGPARPGPARPKPCRGRPGPTRSFRPNQAQPGPGRAQPGPATQANPSQVRPRGLGMASLLGLAEFSLCPVGPAKVWLGLAGPSQGSQA